VGDVGDDPGRYAEAGAMPNEQPRARHPPLVAVVTFAGCGPELVERMLVRVADVLARELGSSPGTSS
jgi:hypothetical protein